jgi:hypothetical protein
VPRDRASLASFVALLLVAALVGGCGGGNGNTNETASGRTATATSTRPTVPKTSQTGRTTTALKPNPRRAVIERTVEKFVGSVERSDAAGACRLLGRPRGTLQGCAEAAGIDLHMFPSSDELSIDRIRFSGRSRASATLAGGQTFTLRRVGHRWLITGLRA